MIIESMRLPFCSGDRKVSGGPVDSGDDCKDSGPVDSGVAAMAVMIVSDMHACLLIQEYLWR